FRTVKIDGRIPFKDMLSYPFDYASGWENDILTNEKGKPYDFYLQKGKHRITLIADPAPYQPVVNTIKDVMDDINDLALEIKMATGNTKDLYRDWHITERIPDIVPRLKELSKVLREQYRYLQTLSETNPDQARNLVISADQLDRLASEPEKIPVRFEQLSKGTDSITKKLGNLLLTLADQPLQLDKIYVFANTKLPDPEASVWLRMKSAVVSFFSSFTRDYTTISHADDREALKIWVNRPRQYVMLMQQLADQYFTKKTGTEVAFSLMPAEEKLILANASGESPDIAMGVQENLPYKLALRGALVDLSQFGDYKNTAARFSEGALLPFYFDGGRYALPSTQDFWVLFYRKDILQALNIAVPSTWEDVKETLPKLQRYGMNFYVPLSGVSAYKEFKVTAPFIYQQGGRLFSKDGMSAAIDSEEALKGFKLMTNLFTIYSSPLQVPNFYSHFRNGTLPMGIADFNQYIHITAAAPELNGQWGIAPYPGIKAENGKTVRWAPGTGKAVIMFRDSHKQKEAWAFMKWWTSAKVQAKFGNMIETIYGTEYRWNTANIKAFSQLPWPEKDINVIKEQWKWLRDIPHIPGDYMVERALSNAWNKVVFDGKNPRRAIEDAVVTANREIRKKLNEFGYVNKSGTVLKPLQMPAILREYGGVPDESGD
ncbi:MAG TPA: extracellular solute-binding protein, partial [Bacillales bacterium]|nr:extracellular solute-binding protein [Bacillales bacterium]